MTKIRVVDIINIVVEERCPSLAEGARLEIVYTGNRIMGSNPILSVL